MGTSNTPASNEPSAQLPNIDAHVTECCVQSQTDGGYDLNSVVSCVSLTFMTSSDILDTTAFIANRIAIFETLVTGIF